MRTLTGVGWWRGFLVCAVGLTLALWISPQQVSFSAEKEEDEQKVSLDQAPTVVQETIKRETAGGVIQEIEKEIEDGKTVYEAEFTKGNDKYELTVAEDGKVLGVEEEGKEDDNDDDDDVEEEGDEGEEEDELKVTFENVAVDKIPEGCLIAETNGQGKKATWKVVEMEGAPSGKKVFALAKSENLADTSNLAIARNIRVKDVELSVKLKPLSGMEAQGGGLIWRVKDANNYYLCDLCCTKPPETSLAVYLVKDGKPELLGSTKVEADPKLWHEIEIKMTGDEIAAEFGEKTLIQVKNDALQEAGNVGVCTRADASTAFDDFEVEEPDDEDHEHHKEK